MSKSECFYTLFDNLNIKSCLPNSSAGYTRLPQEQSNTIQDKRSNLAIVLIVVRCVCLLLAVGLVILGYYDFAVISQRFFKKEVYFKRPNVTKHIPCHKFFEPGVNYSELAKEFRVTYKDPSNETELPTDCDSIMKRNNFYLKSMSKEEQDFSIAYARNVYADYRFLEILLSTTYTPQNYYCYSVDGKASVLFHKRMHELATCFPNVYITNFNATMDSKGHNTNAHHMKCLEWLMKDGKQWKYVVLLQNYDVPLRTNQEIVQIFKWYNGTNDVSTQQRPPWRIGKFSFEALRLFKNSSRNKLVVDGNKPEMPTYRSLVQVAMSRQSIDFIFDNLDLTQAISNFNAGTWTTNDEHIFSSLNSNDNIQLPGGFTQKCIKTAGTVAGLTRYNIWSSSRSLCDGQHWRHDLCVFGLEALQPKLLNNPFFFANKMLPNVDFGAIVCWNEMLFNRTHHDRGIHRLNKSAYVNLPHVRFNYAKNKYGAAFNITRFNCAKYVKDHIGTNIMEAGNKIVP